MVALNSTVFINELHYDNNGTDSGEFVEIAGPAGTDLTGYSVVLYNGSGGASYDTDSLTGLSLTDEQNGYGTVRVAYASNGIQNGSPDGVALVDGSGAVLQFLSYEGVFAATNGAASGLTSTDIGVAEAGTEPAGLSLQLIGSGDSYGDFTWSGPSTNSQDAVNAGQTFTAPAPSVALGDVTVNDGASGTTTATITVTRSGDPNQAFSVNYATADDTATAPSDYGSASGTLTFAAGDLSQTFTVDVSGDTTVEPTETFNVLLSDATGGITISDGTGVGTIANDDTTDISIADASVLEGDGGTSILTFTVTRSGDTTTAVDVAYATGDGSATAGEDYTAETGTVSFAAGDTTAEITIAVSGDETFEGDETLAVTLSGATGGAVFVDDAATGTIRNDDADITRIGAIQGLGHTSSFDGQAVTTSGVVTAVDTNGFYLQDGGDNDVGTSDGIFVFTRTAPTVAVGNRVEVTGTVDEFLPGNDSDNLTITQLTAPTIAVVAASAPLPAATVIGTGGRVPPGVVIDDDGFASYDPTTDGIDFYESLEGMYVQVNDAVAVGPTASFGEIAVVADGGARIAPEDRTPNGGILLEGDPRTGEITDPNPERIIIDDGIVFNEPLVNTGATFAGPITGVIDYSFGNYKLLNDQPLEVATNPAAPESTVLRGNLDRLTVATFNVENLDPTVERAALVPNANEIDDDGPRFAQIAERIFENLNAPDVVALQEIQDNSGAENEDRTGAPDVTAADRTLARLVEAVNRLAEQSGSPALYASLDNPFITDDENGGQPGGNIRNAYIYRTDRVDFVDGSLSTIDAEGNATTAVGSNTDPSNPFNGSRLPLVATFRFNGEDVTIVNNHFSSKGGDTPLFGTTQPPVEVTEAKRIEQALAVNAFVESRLTADGDGNVMVVGDLNDFEFSDTLNALRGVDDGSPILADLITTLPENERYEYIFEGNSQVLDHILTSADLTGQAIYDAVHINADFTAPIRVSDHDPSLASLYIPASRTMGGDGGDDLLRGRGAADTISGGGGEDDLYGGDGNDSLDGGAGDDDLYGSSGDDTLAGDADDDGLYGGDGDDTLVGGDGGDYASGGAGADDLAGGAGGDRLSGFTGDDTLKGGAESDFLAGGGNRDDLQGGSGRDTLLGGTGEDTLDGGGDDDVMIGGDGPDTFVFAPGSGRDLIRIFEGNDRIDLSAFGFASAAEAYDNFDQTTRVLTLNGTDQVRILGELLREDQIDVGPGGNAITAAAA